MIYNLPIFVALGLRNSGLAHVGYTVESVSGDVLVARTEAGVSERVNVNDEACGVYEATLAVHANWGVVRVVWDAADADGLMAEDLIDCASRASVIGVRG